MKMIQKIKDLFSCKFPALYENRNNRTDRLFYRTLFTNSLDGIYRSTPDGRYIDANQALVEMLGYNSKDELMKINIPEDLYYLNSDRPKTDQRNRIFITQLKKKDGTLIWAEINSWVIYDSSSNALYYEGIVRDITERQRVLEELYNTKEELQITLNSIGDGVIVTNTFGEVEMINGIASELTGWKQKEAKGKPVNQFFNIVNEFTRKPVNNPVAKVLSSGRIEGLANHTVLIARDGREKAIADSAAPIHKKDGSIYGVVMVFRDVTHEREMVIRLVASEKRYRNLFENTGTATLIINEDTTISLVNQQMEVLSGYSREEIEGKMSIARFIVDKKELKEVLDYHRICIIDDNKICRPRSYELGFLTREGRIKEILLTIDRVPGTKETIASLLDITERKRTEEKIRYLGFHDSLTGLYNRAYFEEALERFDTSRQLPISIIMGDINNLKLVNDAFGHHRGDELIRKISKIIKDSCRQEDIIARWGGDEFIILLPGTDYGSAVKISERINKTCLETDDEPIHPSIALGVATKVEEEDNIDNIVKKAENWMYKRKLLESKSARSSIISSLEKTLWESNYETEEHAQRLKEMALKMGEALGLSSDKMDELVLLAGLHDIGKVAIPDSILMKPSSLDIEEWEVMRRHPVIGYRIAESSSELAPIADGILHHHERWDGTGYPHGLKGEEIPLISRIIAIVDAYDVMINKRPYKDKKSKKEALEELKRCAGKQFDPVLVRIFIERVI